MSKVTKTTSKTSERTSHRWTNEEKATAISLIGVPRNEAWERFVAAHPETAKVISRQALQGRIFGLRKHASTAPEWRRKALEVELANARGEVARLVSELAAIDAGEPSVDEFIAALAGASMAEVRSAAKERGVKANGSKTDIIERIREATAA